MTLRDSTLESALRSRGMTVASPPALTLTAPSDDALAAMWRGTAPAHVTNHFRRIRRELMMSIDESEPAGAAVILVTSALPGDGKTFVAASIARTFANAPDCMVTLLDLDLVRRTTSRLFDAQRLPGVSDCLNRFTDLRRVTCTTEVARLTFVPAGTKTAESRESFVGAPVDELLATLRATGPGKLHILDAPPIIPVVETAVLAEKADIVVLVVRAGVTPRAAVEESMMRLGAGAKVCIVLNAISLSALAYNYDDAYAAYSSNEQE